MSHERRLAQPPRQTCCSHTPPSHRHLLHQCVAHSSIGRRTDVNTDRTLRGRGAGVCVRCVRTLCCDHMCGVNVCTANGGDLWCAIYSPRPPRRTTLLSRSQSQQQQQQHLLEQLSRSIFNHINIEWKDIADCTHAHKVIYNMLDWLLVFVWFCALPKLYTKSDVIIQTPAKLGLVWCAAREARVLAESHHASRRRSGFMELYVLGMTISHAASITQQQQHRTDGDQLHTIKRTHACKHTSSIQDTETHIAYIYIYISRNWTREC